MADSKSNVHVCDGNCQFDTNVTAQHLLEHVRLGIPTKITHKQLHLLPQRSDFLNQTIASAFSSQVKNKKPIIFLPNAITEKNDWIDGALQYRIYLFGILPCGSKTCVILEDIDVIIDVMVPLTEKATSFDNNLRCQLINKNIVFSKIETIEKFRLHGFQKHKTPYKRIYFNNLQDRKKCIEFIANLNKELKSNGKDKLETANDDTGRSNYYFQKVAREMKFATADWNRFENYQVLDSSQTTNCTHVLKVKVGNFKKLDRKRRNNLSAPGQLLEKVLDRDSTMVAQWDIETHRTIQNGIVPTPADVDYTIFMICSAYFWQWTDEALLDICCVDKDANARRGIKITVICETETNVLLAHMEILGRMSPDILSAFNGGNFDWPLYREKLQRAGLLTKLKSKLSSLPLITKGRYADTEESVARWCFHNEQIKLDADNRHHLDVVADFSGIIDTDVLPIFLKMYPRAEVRKSASLNYFLARNGLDSKEDMSYKRMFKIYERAIRLSNMKTCHCGTAQQHCACCKEHIKELDCKPIVVKDKTMDIEYSDELHDDLLEKCCFCGKRQRNLRDMADIGYYCVIDCVRPQQLYVKRTIVPDKRELSNMSYVSLYDSFYRADGMKVRNVIGSYCHRRDIAFSNARTDKGESDKDHYPGAWVFPPNRGLHSDGLIDITDPITKQKIKIRARPITGLDFNSLYPSLMMAYNLSPDMVVYILEEALKLQAEGYAIHHIKPFDYEKGGKKGSVGNKHLVGEGWTVRHNGVFNPKTDKKIISEYAKYVSFTYERNDEQIGKNIHTVKYMEKTGPSDHQKGELDFVKSNGIKTTRKVSYEPIRDRDALAGECMGIFSYIVKKLFDKRVPMKAEFVRLSKLKEQMDRDKVKTIIVKNAENVETILDYKDVVFNLNKIDSKQKALKTLMNTFYGESGNYQSSIYELLVAAGVTCAGQENIRKIAEFVTKLGFIVHYGDTDSIYISCPDSYYELCDKEYFDEMSKINLQFEGVPKVPEPTENEHGAQAVEFKKQRTGARLKWWNEQVAITMKVMADIKEKVSDYLLFDNNTLYLNMAYEEVGFPTVFCGKKKYFLTPHIEMINFYPKDVFIKGIDDIKQGQALITKQLSSEFRREALSPENERELIDIAETKIRKFYNMKHDVSLFTLNAKYKPNKRNVPVLTFVARMRTQQLKFADDPIMAALYEPPEAGDKFEYILVKKDLRYTLQGNKIEIKKGDQMEFVRVFKASQNTPNPMQIDLSYYMKNTIVGLFARYIAYHVDFQPPPEQFNVMDKEQYRKMDLYCVSEASKYLETICDKITGYNRGNINQQGRDYRSTYTQVSKKVRHNVAKRYGSMGYIIHNINVHRDTDDTSAQSTQIIEQLKVLADNLSSNYSGKEFIKFKKQRDGDSFNIFRLKQTYIGDKYTNISKIRIQLCTRKELNIIEQLYTVIPHASKIIYKYELRFINLIEDMRKIKSDDMDITDDDLTDLNYLDEASVSTISTVYNLLLQLIAVYCIRKQTLDIASEIKLEIAKTIDDCIVPKTESGGAKFTVEILDDHTWF